MTGARDLVAAGASSTDLLIVGPGQLGKLLGVLWLRSYPDAQVVGQTNTTSNHDELRSLGISPRTTEDADGKKFPFVAFCAPALRKLAPEEYAASVAASTKLWDGTGSLVFTSSTAVYKTDDGGVCDEDSPTHPLGASPRVDRILLAEKAVADAGGVSLRLVMLYNSVSGVHKFLEQGVDLRKGLVATIKALIVAGGKAVVQAGIPFLSAPGNTWLSTLHYEDAAAATLAALVAAPRGGGFLRGDVLVASDGAAITLRGIIDVCDAVRRRLPHVPAQQAAAWKPPPGRAKGKRMRSERSAEVLGFKPQFASFADFMYERAGKDWYYDRPVPASHAHG